MSIGANIDGLDLPIVNWESNTKASGIVPEW